MLGANPLPESENTTEISTTTNTILSEQLNETSNLNTTNNDEAFVCAFYNPEFIIISSLGSFYIPCVIMIFLYIRIFSVRTYYLHKNISLLFTEIMFWISLRHNSKEMLVSIFLYK